MRTEEATRVRLWALMQRLPPGCKADFARVCGFAGRQRLKAVARFNAYLTAQVARRLNTIMDAVESGDLMLVDTGLKWPKGYPRLVWQWREPSVRHLCSNR